MTLLIEAAMDLSMNSGEFINQGAPGAPLAEEPESANSTKTIMRDREGRQSWVAPTGRGSANDAGVVAAATESAPKSSPRSPVLVTGASGFVGSAIAAALRARGHDVQVLVRPSSPRTNLDPRDTVREGDLLDPASLAAALKGVRFLFHAAADYRLWARNPEEIVRNNLEGTRHVMVEALRAGVERIVYTSSVATLKLVEGGAATEDRRLAENAAIGAYKLSKVAAERLVEAMVRWDGLPAVIVGSILVSYLLSAGCLYLEVFELATRCVRGACYRFSGLKFCRQQDQKQPQDSP